MPLYVCSVTESLNLLSAAEVVLSYATIHSAVKSLIHSYKCYLMCSFMIVRNRVGEWGKDTNPEWR